MISAAVVAVVLVGAAIFATIQRAHQPTDTPEASPPTTSTQPPLTKAALDGVLLSIGELNGSSDPLR